MPHETNSPLRYTTSARGLCVAEGYAIRINVKHGRLHVCDGYGRARRERLYSRVNAGISRLIVLGHTGYVSFEALRWLSDLGISFAQIDTDGRLLTTSTPGQGDARLRRAQALALGSDAGTEIARSLLRDKVNGQRTVLDQLAATPEAHESFQTAAANLEAADSVNELLIAERDAALAYWSAWAPVAPSFRASDQARVPEHWLRFGQRGSPLTSAPRLAVNPPNALLNYLYAILEAETRIACLTVGLDPSLGIVHADYRARDSLALDVMEAVRPHADKYVLDVIRGRVFRASDFHETRRGVCRILTPLTSQLAETGPTFGQLIAPVVERVAAMLADVPGARISRLATPLTNTKRHAGRTATHKRSRLGKAEWPKLAPSCRGCGGEVPHSERVYCNDCLPTYEREQFEAFAGSGLVAIDGRKAAGHDPTHGGQAARRRGQATAKRKREIADWEREYGRLTDLQVFREKILPTIQTVPLSKLVRITGLSLRYCSQIRRGERVPHPRHWERFRTAASQSAGSAGD